MAMLHMFAQQVPTDNLAVITINHNLRTASADECAMVQSFCDSLGVKCSVHNVDVRQYCNQHGVSTETGARLLRRQLLLDNSSNYDYICLAHNKDDNAETVLMHIVRGSGLKGAQGIASKQDKWLRPVLEFTKQQLLDYCNQNNVPFVTDESNSDTQYMRNYIRHEVMPRLIEFNSGAVDNIVRFAHNATMDNEFLDKLADISSVRFATDSATIPLQLLAEPSIAYRVLDKVLCRMGYCHDIAKINFDDISKLQNLPTAKRITLPFNLVAIREYDALTICKDSLYTADYQYVFGVGRYSTPHGTVCVDIVPPNSNVPIVGKLLMLDGNKVPSNAVIRPMQANDAFCKFGGGTKSIRRYLTDCKIPQRLRATLPLVCSQHNVLAVCGVEISSSVKTTPSSTIYYIYITKEDTPNGTN